MSARVTMQDIADALGLSRNTVSKAINNTGIIAPGTRELILRKAMEMGYRQFSDASFSGLSIPGINPEGYRLQMMSGTLVRHLVLPGCSRDSEALMDYLGTLPKGSITISLLRQYTPYADAEQYPEINRRITTLEYERVVNRALQNGLDGFRQASASATMALRPVFDGSGL